jgi:hypothetical protein
MNVEQISPLHAELDEKHYVNDMKLQQLLVATSVTVGCTTQQTCISPTSVKSLENEMNNDTHSGLVHSTTTAVPRRPVWGKENPQS